MSNSGKIAGRSRSATHMMQAQRQKITDVTGDKNRASRRAYAAMARKNKPILDQASILAVKVFNGDAQKAKDWLYGYEVGEDSPIEQIITGHGKSVIAQLKAMISEIH
jgi:hypothetical protein